MSMIDSRGPRLVISSQRSRHNVTKLLRAMPMKVATEEAQSSVAG